MKGCVCVDIPVSIMWSTMQSVSNDPVWMDMYVWISLSLLCGVQCSLSLMAMYGWMCMCGYLCLYYVEYSAVCQ